jgi:DNA-binding PucR family transcriptional regulator
MPETVAVLSDRINRLHEVAPAREACRWNLQVAEAMGARSWVTPRTVGSFPSLMASVSHRVADQFLKDTIARVAENGSVKEKTVLDTLEAYLATGRRPQETADMLGIHVSTLRYRLNRIAEKSGINLNDPDECFELELALRIQKFRISYQK